MATTLTEYYDLEKPELEASTDDWGRILNETIDKIDAAIRNTLQVSSHPAFNTPMTAQGTNLPLYIPPQDPTLPPAALQGGHLAATQQYVDARCLFYLNKFFPPGSIMMWSGAFGSVPAGWTFCDGSLGSPDLRGRFVLCANNAAPVIGPWAVGGKLTAYPGEHVHQLTFNFYPGPYVEGAPVYGVKNSEALYSGDQQTLPYIAQMYIWKYAYW
jgi:hypothetical protein